MERVTSLAYYLREIAILRERLRSRDAAIAVLQSQLEDLRQEVKDERDANRGLQKAYDNKCRTVELLRRNP